MHSFSMFFNFKTTANDLLLREEADFGTLNDRHSTAVGAQPNIQLATEPYFLQNVTNQ